MTTGTSILDSLVASLPDLARDRAQETPEQHAPNDFYGHATMLKEFVGLPAADPLRLSIQHGIRLDRGHWLHDYHKEHRIGVVHSQWRAEVVAPQVQRRIVPIGPYIHYTQSLLTPEELADTRARLGRTLLVFPAHSTHWIDVDYNLDQFCQQLSAAAQGFQTTLICLYWKDVLRGMATEYTRRGFKCVTAGHMFDCDFMKRLRTYLELADATLANEVGSHLGYSLHLGKPHQLLPAQLTRSSGNATRGAESSADKRLEIPRYFELFAGPPETITDEQRTFVGKYWGFADVKNAGQIQELIAEAAAQRDRHVRRAAWRRRLGPLGRFISD